MLGIFVFPAHCNTLLKKTRNSIAGIAQEYMKKYDDASCQIFGSAPIREGKCGLKLIPIKASKHAVIQHIKTLHGKLFWPDLYHLLRLHELPEPKIP